MGSKVSSVRTLLLVFLNRTLFSTRTWLWKKHLHQRSYSAICPSCSLFLMLTRKRYSLIEVFSSFALRIWDGAECVCALSRKVLLCNCHHDSRRKKLVSEKCSVNITNWYDFVRVILWRKPYNHVSNVWSPGNVDAYLTGNVASQSRVSFAPSQNKKR